MTAQEHCMHFYAIEFVYKSKDYKNVTGVAFTMNVTLSQLMSIIQVVCFQGFQGINKGQQVKFYLHFRVQRK